jgi:hypothetical protein
MDRQSISKQSQKQKIILKSHNGNSVLPIHIMFFCFITAVSIFIPTYLLDFMRYVSYTFSFLFAVEETFYCGAKGITASIHIARKAPQTVQVNLIYILGDCYCTQKENFVSLL